MLDLIGYATVPEDAQVAGEVLRGVLLYLMSLPWWLPWGFALISTLFLMRVSWPRSHTGMDPLATHQPNVFQSNHVSIAENDADPFLDATEGEAHERLELFIIDFLSKAIWRQFELQKRLVSHICNNEKVLHFAIYGLQHDYSHYSFCTKAELVLSLGGSPMPVYTVRVLIDAITTLENQTYWRFCQQANELADIAQVDIRCDDELSQLWNDWRQTHNDLVKAFDQLKRESRFPKPLYRPQRESRFGGIVEVN